MIRNFRINMWACLLFPVSAILLVTGCQNDLLETTGLRSLKKELTIQATYEMPDWDDTKTVRDASANIYWTPGDAISLFYGSGTDGGSKFVALTETVSKTTNFSGTITAVTGGADIEEGDTYFWGLYPYDETATCDGQTVTMTIPAVQPGMDDTFAPGFAPSLGHSQGLMLSFRNIWSGFGFTVSNPGYQTLTFRGNNNEYLAGRAKIGIENGLPKVVQIVDGICEVTLNSPDAGGFVPGKYYYMQFFPITLENGFTVEISNSTTTGTYVYTESMEYPRSTWKRAKNVDTRCTSFRERDIFRSDFEDEHFANYVFNNFDANKDGKLTSQERNLVYSIEVRTDTVASLRGVEYFPNLVYLSCRGVQNWNSETQEYDNGLLTSLDLRGNLRLQDLHCYNNRLTSLDISNNKELRIINCYGNQLQSLDVTNATSLSSLDCGSNLLTSIDVTKNPSLEYLYCYSNQITSLDVTKNFALKDLSCSSTLIQSLNISNNTELEVIDVGNLGLTALDLSNKPNLLELYCDNNNLTSVDVSAHTGLRYLNVSYNPLNSFDISNNPNLVYLACAGLSLTSLDVSHLSQLDELRCQSNQLTSLDLSANQQLRYLYCSSNLLTELDFSGNPLLYYVSCSYNSINDIDISSNALLLYLYAQYNQLETLDVSCNPKLYTLNARNNPLHTLYVAEGQTITNEFLPNGVSKVVKQLDAMDIDENAFPDANFRAYVINNFDLNHDGKLTMPERLSVTSIGISTTNVASLEGIGYFPNITSLYAYGSRNWNTGENYGQLTSVDLSGNLLLKNLGLYYNHLTSLDLSNHVYLRSVDLGYNDISSLILPVSDRLEELKCHNNKLTSLDVSGYPALRILLFFENKISSINLTNNPALEQLECFDTNLSTLDLSKNTELISLDCSIMPNLTSLDLTGNTMLDYVYMYYCPSLQTVSLPETLPYVTDWAFASCESLKTIVIPSSVAFVGDYAFAYSNALESITINSVTPPEGGYRMFYEAGNFPIYVPATAVDAYKAAGYWNEYSDRIKSLAGGDNEDIGYDEW